MSVSSNSGSREVAATVQLRSLLFDHIDDLVLIASPDGTIVDANREVGALFGYDDAQALIGKSLSSVLGPTSEGHLFLGEFDRSDDAISNFVAEATRRDGATAVLDTKAIWSASADRIFILSRDVSEEIRKASEMAVQLAALTQMAYTDVLTGLPNRLAYEEWIASRSHGEVGGWLVLLDVDRFKKINDTFGHPGGDLFLTEFGSRLRKTVRGLDRVARIGGDEFALLLPSSMNENTLRGRLRYLASQLNPRYHIQGIEFRAKFSAGASFCPAWWTTKQWVANADAALYESKGDPDIEFTIQTQAPDEEPPEPAAQD